MLRITILSGARAGARFELAKPLIRFGRSPDNDVVFDAHVDLDASAHHAEIRVEDGQWVLVDRESRNGLFESTNEGQRRVARHVLTTPYEVQFGPVGPRVSIEVLAYPGQDAGAIGLAGADVTAFSPGPPTEKLGDAPLPYAPETAPPPALPAAAAVDPSAAPAPPPPAPAPAPKPGKSTLEIKALVDANVQQATGRLRTVVLVLAALVVLGAATTAFVLLRTRGPGSKGTFPLPVGSTGEGGDIGRAIYEQNKNALFMLVAHHGDDYEKGGFCTAFAIEPRVLASNAHCVRAAEEAEDGGAEIWAHLNESAQKGKAPTMLRVGKHRGHPRYQHDSQSITPDVGLFALEDADAPNTVTLAGNAELEALGAGDPLYVLGFPGRTMDEDSPVAVFMFSHVGRITDEHGQQADDFADAWLIQHEGQTTPGTSGSPIFDNGGHVVAINAGGLLEQNQQAVYKYAMRIDLLRAIDLSKASDGDDGGDDDAPKKKKKKKKKKTSDDDD